MGKASTSVGPLPPRKRSLSSEIVVASTKSSDISVSAPRRSITRSSSSTSCASRTHLATSTGTSCCSSAPNTVGTASTFTRSSLFVAAGIALLVVASVRVDDLLDDPVAHHVVRAELDEHETVDAVEHVAYLEQSGPIPAVGQIDLRHVARHDGLRTEAEPGEEHLHLLGGRVL